MKHFILKVGDSFISYVTYGINIVGKGMNWILTGEGNDTIAVKMGDNIVNAGDGDNTVEGGSGKDSLSSGKGNDKLIGGAGDDALSAGDGNNTLNGGSGNNQLTADGREDQFTSFFAGGNDDTGNLWGEGDGAFYLGGGRNIINVETSGHVDIYIAGQDTIVPYSLGTKTVHIEVHGCTPTTVLDLSQCFTKEYTSTGLNLDRVGPEEVHTENGVTYIGTYAELVGFTGVMNFYPDVFSPYPV